MGPEDNMFKAFLCMVTFVTVMSDIATVDPFDSRWRCQKTPDWKIGDRSPLSESLGKASKLEVLRQTFISGNKHDVKFMIVNSEEFWSIVYKSELEKRTDIAVYQDRPRLNIWSTLEGIKDDFLIYDRCGHLNYHIRMPYAHLGYNIVETAIRVTYDGVGICQNCVAESVPVSTVAESVPVSQTNSPDREFTVIVTDVVDEVNPTTEERERIKLD